MDGSDSCGRRQPVAWLGGGVIAALLGLSLIAAAAVMMKPDFAASRIAAPILPPDATHAYAACLLRNLAIWAVGASLLLGAFWLPKRLLSMASLGRWCLLTCLGLYLSLSLTFWWYVNDDAGISYAYSRNIAEGLGPVFNPGDDPVEGYSNPFWTYLLAAAHRGGADIVITAKTLGMLLGGACLLLIWSLVGKEHPLCWLTMPLAASNASSVIWFNSGLENALHGLLLTACVPLLTRAVRRDRLSIPLVVVLCLMVTSRPEGALFGFLASFYLGWFTWHAGRPTRPAVTTCAVFVAFLVGWIGLRYLLFHDVLPNTYYAKASHTSPLRVLNLFSGGWDYTRRAFEGCGWMIAMVPLLLAIAGRRRWPDWMPAALLIVGGQLFFIISVNGDWMGEWRFLSYVAPLVSAVIGVGFVRLRQCATGSLLSPGACAAVCALVALLIGSLQLQRLIRFAHEPTTSLQVVADIGQYFKTLARRGGIDDPLLLDHDAGGTAYVARIRLLDLAGLCDRVFAREFRDRERIRRYIFEEKRPTFIYSSKAFADRIGLETFEEFHTGYVPLPPAPRYALDGYIRRVRKDLYHKIFPDSRD